jgi:Transmembrane secretion effector
LSAAVRRSFDSLSVPNYRRYFAGQIVSVSGNWMQMVAEVWLMLSLTGSGVAVGMTTALQFLPILLAGWLSQAYDPRVALLLAAVAGLSAAWAARVSLGRIAARAPKREATAPA